MADILRAVPSADVDPAEDIAWARTLVTGDLTHFGPLMERGDPPLTIRTPRAFLMEGLPV